MKIKAIFYLPILVFSIYNQSCTNNNTDNRENVTDTVLKITKAVYIPPHINTPDDAIAEIKSGNERYVNHQMINTNIKEMIEHTSDDQHPFVAVLGCIDSRVPAELIFDQGIGNMFVARVAGNVEDPYILGSLEYATKVKGAKLIIVLGHNKCGAINGAIEDVKLGNLTQLLKQIKPAITPDSTGNVMQTSNNTGRRNVQLTMERIHKKSPVMNELIKQGKLKMIGAYYDVTSGKIYYEDDLKKWW
jgi:carbonic anhydrase